MTEQQIHEILSLRASGLTRRWHTLQHHAPGQNVAEHSAQALTLLLLLHPDPSLNLIRAVLWHDSAERGVGDVPSPARRANPKYAKAYEEAEMDFMRQHHPTAYVSLINLTHDEKMWLGAVDVLDLVMWCSDQVMLGNQHAVIVLERALIYLRENKSTPAQVTEFMDRFEEEGPQSFA